jgi:hypothetical protein
MVDKCVAMRIGKLPDLAAERLSRPLPLAK